MMPITDLQIGDVYRLKGDNAAVVLAQVAAGGDVGFFRASDPDAINAQALEFRVIVNQPDFKRHWIRIGNYPVAAPLGAFAWYGDSDIGLDQNYKVRLDNIDVRTPIDATQFDALERLAVWETVHVLQRLATD